MKKTFAIIILTVLVWGCAKKIAPVASSGGTISSGTAATANTPAPPPVNVPASSTPVPASPSTPGGSRVPASDSSKTASPEVTGQITYNTKCGKCHGLKVTTDYTNDRWISIMQVMAIKAQLTNDEKENVLAYVKANAKK